MNHERRVALIHLGEKTASARQIREQLSLAGLHVIEMAMEREDAAPSLDGAQDEDVAILNLGNFAFDASAFIHQVSQAYGDRLIINDALIVDRLTGWERKRWLRHLLHKIDPGFSVLPVANAPRPAYQKVAIPGVEAVWVLAASIGGPEVVREFLAALPDDLPALFILAQHLGGDFQPMLRQQLAAATRMPVEIPWPGLRLQAGMVVLAPPAEKLLIDEQGRVDLQPMTVSTTLTPSIDAVCELALNQLEQVHMAVFSGMSTDGVAGAQHVAAAGGKVIVQTPQSTVVDSIIQGVKSRLRPSFEGAPADMARYIAQSLMH